ncbi:alpha-mannosidase 2-like isoform X3 [Rhodnius prolixus]|uniref:alpha-mannosidase 2-like isoform X3 n=1 Tax=Rhodnius prolixus TaxID=13249 RepID=UPI003D18E6C4
MRLWWRTVGFHYISTPIHQVFIVPFSHNDAFWLETFEGYYEKKSRHILDNIATILPTLPEMRFVWSEICFLQHWWERASDGARSRMKYLIKNGQLEIVTGGWVMPDEATTQLFGLLNQLIEGHQWLYQQIGILPETGWSIDPFGVGSTIPYLLTAAGINKGYLIQRIHFAWKRFLARIGGLDAVWRPDFTNNDQYDMPLRVQHSSTYSLTDSCGILPKLCSLYDFNRAKKAVNFSNIRRRAEVLLGLYGRGGVMSEYNTNLVTLGGDFRFENASEVYRQYRNYKAIMNYVAANNNSYSGANLKFSTLADYFDEIPRKRRLILKGDFFPYCDLSKFKMDCWTGYYTTRPFYKKLSRMVDNSLRATEIFFTLTINRMDDELNKIPKFVKLYRKLIRARRNSALFQHHDGITGTSKQCVMEYYKKSLLASLDDLKFIQKTCISMYFNVSLSDIDEEILVPAKLIIFNSLAKVVNADVSVNISSPYVSVSHCGSEVDHQIVNQQGFSGKYNLILYPTLPPLSVTIFDLYPTSTPRQCLNTIPITERTFKLINQQQKLYFIDGLLNFIEMNGQLYRTILKLKGYEPVAGDSGAYLFRPYCSHIWSTDRTYGIVTALGGQLYDEVSTKFLYATLTTRLYKYGELASLVELSIESLYLTKNIELTMELITDMNDDAKWYTDVNDFHFRQRMYAENLCIAANYYPMSSIVYIENEIWRLALVADHSHGTCYCDGHLEIMLNRRISTDDGKGIGEGITDNSTVVSKFYLLIENSSCPTTRLFSVSKILNNPLITHLLKNNQTLPSLYFLDSLLDENIHLLNFRTLSKNLNYPSKEALLILQNYHANETLQPFQSETPFIGLRENKIVSATITGIKTIKDIDSFDEIKILPSTLTTLKISF